MSPWAVEDIPDPDRLFYRVHRNSLGTNGEIVPGVFREREGSISTDWEKYSTADEARQRARVPAANGIVSLFAGEVRRLDLLVRHEPDEARHNRAHAGIHGLETDPERKVELRFRLLDLVSGWVIPPDSNGQSAAQ